MVELCLLFALSLFGLVACSKASGEEIQTKPGFKTEGDSVHVDPSVPSPVRFQVAPVEIGARLQSPLVTGRVSTIDALTAPSFAPLEGHVAEVAVKLGDTVRSGDKLVLVRTTELAQLQQDLRATKLAAATQRSIVERTKQLVEARAASQNDLIVAESELDEAKFASQAAAARLQSLSVKLAGDTSYWVLANRSGVVVSLDATPGKQVGPSNERPIAIVADLDEVWVLGDVPQRDAISLGVGLSAEIFVPGRAERVQTGVVETVADVVDVERQTVPIRVRAPNKERTLRPNSYVTLSFAPREDEQILQVPAVSVVSDGAESVVFVQEANGAFKRRVVQLGFQTRERAEILRGLEAGEKVVVSGALLLLNALHLDG